MITGFFLSDIGLELCSYFFCLTFCSTFSVKPLNAAVKQTFQGV